MKDREYEIEKRARDKAIRMKRKMKQKNREHDLGV